MTFMVSIQSKHGIKKDTSVAEKIFIFGWKQLPLNLKLQDGGQLLVNLLC